MIYCLAADSFLKSSSPSELTTGKCFLAVSAFSMAVPGVATKAHQRLRHIRYTLSVANQDQSTCRSPALLKVRAYILKREALTGQFLEASTCPPSIQIHRIRFPFATLPCRTTPHVESHRRANRPKQQISKLRCPHSDDIFAVDSQESVSRLNLFGYVGRSTS
mmetsp:Transcript_68648/g.143253  ORF Transcript_68648/g.143253 Transcript_68648/m.143253 type:complete len:163 (+) Transcript_68648:87-575(+)